ncbi:MAG: chemotaxis protein CheW [Desulfurivibrio sp.]|nr:chemotaxis protein CheW [Desulfurivibrio sp.]
MTNAQVTADNDLLAGKYLTFALGDEEYGVAIVKIREIIGMMKITSMPKMPEHVKGVINLRGLVIPIVDLRLRFGMEEVEHTERTCIIVVEVENHDSNHLVVGTVVDSVSEVLNIKADEIEDAPAMGAALDDDFLLGMAKIEGGVKILLDIDRALRPEVPDMMAGVGEHDQPANP